MAAPASPDRERSVIVPLGQLIVTALWLGAALFFAAVIAPGAFAVLPSRELAGAVVGRALPALFIAGVTVGASVVLVEARRRPGLARARIVAAGAMALSCAIAQFVVAPRIAELRSSLTAPLATLPASDPERIAFGRLHLMSVAWLGCAMVAGGVVAGSAARTLGPRRAG
jgi:hypothetical protein